MATIFEQKLYEIGDTCYVIAASVTQPFLYTRFKGIVQKRKIRNDNISYFIQITDVLETKEYLQEHVHRNQFRMYHMQAGRGGLKSLDCFDLLINPADFNTKFRKRYRDWVLVASSLHVTNDQNELSKLTKKSVKIMKEHISKSIQILDERQQTI